VDVVGHDDEGVEFVCVLGAIVLEYFEEEFGVRGELEEAAAVAGDGGDEEGAGGGGSRGFRHADSIGVALARRFLARVNARKRFGAREEMIGVRKKDRRSGKGQISRCALRASLRPSAERMRLRRGCFLARVNAGPSGSMAYTEGVVSELLNPHLKTRCGAPGIHWLHDAEPVVNEYAQPVIVVVPTDRQPIERFRLLSVRKLECAVLMGDGFDRGLESPPIWSRSTSHMNRQAYRFTLPLG